MAERAVVAAPLLHNQVAPAPCITKPMAAVAASKLSAPRCKATSCYYVDVTCVPSGRDGKPNPLGSPLPAPRPTPVQVAAPLFEDEQRTQYRGFVDLLDIVAAVVAASRQPAGSAHALRARAPAAARQVAMQPVGSIRAMDNDAQLVFQAQLGSSLLELSVWGRALAGCSRRGAVKCRAAKPVAAVCGRLLAQPRI